MDGADDAEAINDFVSDKFGVVAADFAMVEIVVLTAIFHERGERGRQFLWLVFGDEVHHVIGHEGGKPSDMFAGGFQIVRGPDGGGSHDFDLAEVAAGFFCPFADEAEAPIDQVRVGELENDAMAYASPAAQSFMSFARAPDPGHSSTLTA